MIMGEGRRRFYNEFLLRMSSSLSKRWMCVLQKKENLSRGFLSEWHILHLWVMRVYIVWVKGKEVTYKILQAECFATVSREGLTRETLAKTTAWHDSSASSHVLLMCSFMAQLLVGFSQNPLIFHLSLSFHQLNTKLNTIKSHKIQGKKLFVMK